MLVTLGGKTSVRFDIAPTGLLVVLRSNFLYRNDFRDDIHAKIGIWFVNGSIFTFNDFYPNCDPINDLEAYEVMSS